MQRRGAAMVGCRPGTYVQLPAACTCNLHAGNGWMPPRHMCVQLPGSTPAACTRNLHAGTVCLLQGRIGIRHGAAASWAKRLQNYMPAVQKTRNVFRHTLFVMQKKLDEAARRTVQVGEAEGKGGQPEGQGDDADLVIGPGNVLLPRRQPQRRVVRWGQKDV